MARKIRLLRTLLFSIAIAGALTFGTGTALQAASAARECPSFAIGACNSQSNCQLKCDLRYPGAGLYGECENECCFCLE
ncbi:MAG TPA: hypothetical protein VHG08_19455 [Longimicrobium sp.]|nr:hypothetical protein [Longimicrobium sp.]